MREDVASCAACILRYMCAHATPTSSHNFDQITPATRCKCATNPDPPSPNMRAGERAKMCAKIITLRNQQKCTILDPKNQIMIVLVFILSRYWFKSIILGCSSPSIKKIIKFSFFRDF